MVKKKIPVIQVRMIASKWAKDNNAPIKTPLPKPEKPEPEKPKLEKPELEKPELEKPEPEKPVPEKPEPEKPAPKKLKIEKPEPKKLKPESKKLKPESKKIKPEPEKPEIKKPKTKKTEIKKPEIKKKEAKKTAAPAKKTKPKGSLPAPVNIDKVDKKKVKKSLKKDTYDALKARKSALEKIRGKVKKESKEKLAAPEKLVKRKPKAAPAAKHRIAAKKEDEKNKFGSRFGNKSDGDAIAGPGDLIKLRGLARYNTEIKNRIEGNWAYSPLRTKEFSGLEALVSISIMPNGEIKDINLDKKSGSQYFDESIYQAALKSSPLPPLPELPSGYKTPYIMRFRFIPPEKK